MRLTSETDHFPYSYPGIVCYFTMADGAPHQCRARDDLRSAVRAALDGGPPLYAVWPGQYRSDLFRVDDLDRLAVAVKA